MAKSHRKIQVWIRTSGTDYEVLLFKTTPERGGFWQPVTGSVEEGESFEVAALRELREETGLVGVELRPLDFEFTFEDRFGRKVTEKVFWVRLERKSKVVIDPKEHVEFRWVLHGEAGRMLKFPSNVTALEKLCSLRSVGQSE